MTTVLVGKALSPFFALVLVWAVTAPVRRKIEEKMHDGRFKRFLLSKVN